MTAAWISGHRLRGAGLLGPTLVVVPAVAILLGLGTWQWQRKAWKEDLVATIAARAQAQPLDAQTFAKRPCAAVELVGLAQSCEYTPVALTGTFDHARERHVYTGIAKPAGGGVGGQGYWIMTPFKVTETGETVAVSRGFVPQALKEPASRGEQLNADQTTFIGLIRSAEPRATFTGANDTAKNMWYLRNPAELFAGSGPAAVSKSHLFIDLREPRPVSGIPQPTAGRVDIPNRHLEYALTWWALAVTLIGVFAAFAIGRLAASRRG
jgi:surfeit locus 1 family protein